jgi:hypothetical protein
VPPLLWNAIASSLPAVVEKGAHGRAQQNNVIAYLRAGDVAELQGKSSSQDIPYPDPVRLAALLSDPVVRQRLDRTFLKGRLRGGMARVKALILNYAYIMIGIGITLAFGSAFVAPYKSLRHYRHDVVS